jgi:hypothetical protein
LPPASYKIKQYQEEMKMMKILSTKLYEEVKFGFSMFSDNRVCIIGEQEVELHDGRIVEQFIYNIIGQPAENGKPFAALKANIILEGN